MATTLFTVTVHELIEYVITIEADSEAEARDKWEGLPVADYNGATEVIMRRIKRVTEGSYAEGEDDEN